MDSNVSAKAQKIPLVVALVGQKELMPEYEAGAAAEVRALFTRLMERYPHTPVIAMSTLAWKTDLLLAQAALGAGCVLFATLPMEADTMRESMDEQETEQFNALLNCAARTFVVPSYEKPPQVEEGEDIPQEYYFRQAGVYLARHSSITLVCHDGIKRDLGLDAFAYDTMTLAREQPFSKMAGTGARENSGVVMELITPREHGPRITLPLPLQLKAYADSMRQFKYVDGYNREAGQKDALIQKRIADAKALIMDEHRESELKWSEAALLKIAAQADILAQRTMETRFLTVLCVCIALLVTLFVFIGNAGGNIDMLIGEIIVAAAMAALVISMCGVWRYPGKFLRYTLLSRYVKVQFYLEIANMRDYHFPFDVRLRDDDVDFAARTATLFRKPSWTGVLMGSMGIIRDKWLGGFFADNYGAVTGEEYLAAAKKQAALVLAASAAFTILVFCLEVYADFSFPLLPLNIFLTAAGVFFIWLAYQSGAQGITDWAGVNARLCRVMRLAKKRMDAAAEKKDRKEQYYVLLLTANAFIEESVEWHAYHAVKLWRRRRRHL